MKRNTLIMIMGLSFFISGCMEDVYDPNYRTPVPDELKDLKASADFDWSTTKNIQLTVNVNDKYQGKYYYEVSVYDSNPFFDANAQLLTKGLAKGNKSFSTTLTISQDIEQLYICQSLKMKDGSKQEYVRTIDIITENLSCNFAGNANTVGKPQFSPSNTTYKEKDITIPSNAIAIEGNKPILPEKDKTYIIKAGTTYNGNFGFTNNNVTIYVAGTFAPTSQINGNNNRIIVLKGGQLRTDLGVDLNNSTHIINYGTAQLNSGCQISGNNTYIENYGKITIAKEVSINSSGKFYNQNHSNIGSVYITKEGTTFTNQGQLYVSGDFKVNSDAQFKNECYAQIDGALISEVTAKNIIICSDAMISCKRFETEWEKGITLYPHAILDITESAKLSGRSNIKNPEDKNEDNNTAFIKINSLKDGSFDQWNKLKFEGAIQLYLANGEIGKNTTEGSVEFIKSLEDAVVINPSGCNGQGINTNIIDKEPEGSNFPIIVSPNQSYTFLMEDNWPIYGDYDMNDLVMDIELEYEEEEDGYIKELEIEAILRAVGASKSLGAAIQLDKVPVGNIKEIEFEDINRVALNGSVFDCINGLEKDQELAVIPFFDNAHKVLGVPAGTLANTGKENSLVKPKEFEIEIKFKKNTVKREDINIKNLNFFIVTDGKKYGRKEVHLKGFKPTQKASRILLNSNCDAYDVAPYLSKDNLIWGLMVPSKENKRFKYPKENKNIKDAYPMFEKWAVSGGKDNKDWYQSENAQKEYIYN